MRFFVPLLTLNFALCQDCKTKNGTIDSVLHAYDDNIVGNCVNSYFQIEVFANKSVTSPDFQLDIKEEGEMLLHLDPAETVSNSTLRLATSGNSFHVALTSTGDLPFELRYKEIKPTISTKVFEFSNGDYTDEDVQPYSHSRHVFVGSKEVQLIEMSWDLGNHLDEVSTSKSTAFGYLSVKNGNGKITLLSATMGKNVALAVESKIINSTGVGGPKRKPIEIDLVTRKMASDVGESRKVRIEYDLGKAGDLNVTTVSPAPPTAGGLENLSPIEIFVVAVNENDSVTIMEDKLATLNDFVSSIDHRCYLIRTGYKSCKSRCHMSSDPDRGCLSVKVAVSYGLGCEYFSSDLLKGLESKFYSRLVEIHQRQQD